MSNPARELAALLESWRVPPGHSIAKVRGEAGGVPSNYGRPEFWFYVASAMRLALEFEKAIDGLGARGRAVQHYRDMLPDIYMTIFAPRQDWGTTSPQPSESNASSGLTNGLLAAGDAIEGLAFGETLTQTRLERIVEGLHGLYDETRSLPDSLDHEMLRYKIEQALRFAQHIDRFGENAVVDLVSQVVEAGVSVLNADDLDDSAKPRFKDFLYQVFVNMVASEAGQGALALLLGPGADAVKAILPNGH